MNFNYNLIYRGKIKSYQSFDSNKEFYLEAFNINFNYMPKTCNGGLYRIILNGNLKSLTSSTYKFIDVCSRLYHSDSIFNNITKS